MKETCMAALETGTYGDWTKRGFTGYVRYGGAEGWAENALFELRPGAPLIWHRGRWRGTMDLVDWRSGTWLGGSAIRIDWMDGTWLDGEWEQGVWHGGRWKGGVWHNGMWHDGAWYGGTWEHGCWINGRWKGGEWLGGWWIDDRGGHHTDGSPAKGGKRNA